MKKVGNGTDTKFWDDKWIGCDLLSDKFKRLHALEIDKKCSISDRISLHSGQLSFNWSQRHAPCGREIGELVALLECLQGFSLHPSQPDYWSWTKSAEEAYSGRNMA